MGCIKPDGIRKTYVNFVYLVRHRGSGKYLRYPESGNRFRLVDDPESWARVSEQGHSKARDWLADLPEQDFPGRTRREDYDVVRQMVECFERLTVLPPRKKTNKKGKRK